MIFSIAAIVGIIVGVLCWNLRAGATAFALTLLAIIIIIGVVAYDTVAHAPPPTPAPTVGMAPLRFEPRATSVPTIVRPTSPR